MCLGGPLGAQHVMCLGLRVTARIGKRADGGGVRRGTYQMIPPTYPDTLQPKLSVQTSDMLVFL